MTPCGRRWASLVATAVVGVAGLAAANARPFATDVWSVQTVALTDVAQAEAVAADLRDATLPAYVEATVRDGVTWHRVRVGCFGSDADARLVADLARAAGADAAAVVPSDGAPPDVPCVAREIGFVAPDAWRQRAEGVPSFGVEVDGVRGVLRYAEAGWQVLQAPAADAVRDRRAEDAVFAQAGPPDAPYVTWLGGNAPSPVCRGALLAQTDAAAIVRTGDTVAACRVRPPERSR